MLNEIAIIPQVLDQSSQPIVDNWINQLRELLHSLRPNSTSKATSLAISNLYGGSSFGVLQEMVDHAINDHRARGLAIELVKAIEKLLVARPAIGDVWPQTAKEWLAEAIASSRIEPIGTIISTFPDQSCEQVRPLKAISDNEFWNFDRPTRPLPMKLKEQILTLRPICIHSAFMAICSPYFLSTENAFVFEVIKQALHRPSGFTPIRSLDIHTTVQSHEISAERSNPPNWEYWRKRLNNVWSGPGVLRLLKWPKLRERSIIAGEYSTLPSARWAVSLAHFAQNERETGEPTTWSLLPRKEVGDLYNRFVIV